MSADEVKQGLTKQCLSCYMPLIIKEELLCFSVFSDHKCCKNVAYSLNEAKALQAVSVGSVRCVLQSFFYSVFPVTLMHAGLPYMGMPARAHRPVPAPSLFCSDTAVLCSLLRGLLSALCSRWLQISVFCFVLFF